MRKHMAMLRLDVLSGGGMLFLLVLILMSPMFQKGEASFRTATQTWWNLGDLAQNTTLFSIAAAAGGAWYGSRTGRMQTREMVERPGKGWRVPITSDLLLVGSLALIVLNGGYLTTASFMAQSTYQGPFPWVALLIGNLFAICFVLVGYVLGSLVRTWFAPLLAGIALWPAIVTMGFKPQLDVLNPGRFVDRIYGTVGLHEPDYRIATYLALTLTLLACALFLLIGMIRQLPATFGIAFVAMLIGSGVFANLAIDRGSEIGLDGLHFYDVTPVCESGTLITYCVNPVNKAGLDDTTQAIDRIAVQVHGIANVTTNYYGFGLNENSRPTNAIFFQDQGDSGVTAFYFALQLTTRNDVLNVPTAAQLAVACGMVDVAGYQGCDIIAPFTLEGQAIQTLDQEEALTKQIEGARARFSSMSPEGRQSWLAANWQALVTGSLDLAGVA